jgi:hypothetical protein
MCVHYGEGAWDADSGNGYYGGFQMDMTFMESYGAPYLQSLGTANNWPPSVQLSVAYRGWLAQGWAAWPNTSAACGLT